MSWVFPTLSLSLSPMTCPASFTIGILWIFFLSIKAAASAWLHTSHETWMIRSWNHARTAWKEYPWLFSQVTAWSPATTSPRPPLFLPAWSEQSITHQSVIGGYKPSTKRRKGLEPTPREASALSCLEMTPVHLSSPSTTGSADTNSKWWSISSSVWPAMAVTIVVDMTSPRSEEGPTCHPDKHLNPGARNRGWSEEEYLVNGDLWLKIDTKVVVAQQGEVLGPFAGDDPFRVLIQPRPEVLPGGEDRGPHLGASWTVSVVPVHGAAGAGEGSLGTNRGELQRNGSARHCKF